MGIGIGAGLAGLLVSYHAELPTGPCIVLACGLVYVVSVLFGRRDGILVQRLQAARHRIA